MQTFNGSTVLANGAIKTLQELIVAAITARGVVPAAGAVYPTAKSKTDALNRMVGNRSLAEGIIRPMGDVYMMDVPGGVLNGAVNTNDGVTLAAAAFTASPGGGDLVLANQVKSLFKGLDSGSRVFYNGSGADVVIYIDVSF